MLFMILNKTPRDVYETPPNALLVMETTQKPLKQAIHLSILSNAPQNWLENFMVESILYLSCML